jgi:hypothetical protein
MGEECGRLADESALGWEGHIADLDDDGEDEVGFWCPACAAREFHLSDADRPPD